MKLNHLTINLRKKINPIKRAWLILSAKIERIKFNLNAPALFISRSSRCHAGSVFNLIWRRRMEKTAYALEPGRAYVPSFSFRTLAVLVILSMVFSQVLNISAYEAHVINVTAQIKNDIPDIDPEGGEYCDVTTVLITLSTAYAAADIIYTLDGSDPACPADSAGEYDYTAPFYLTENASTTLKARSCHGGKQSAIAAVEFVSNDELCLPYCGDGDLDAGEECDDGNNESGDGCDNNCRRECVPALEVCDLIDNDCDGLIDNNIFEDFEASGTPIQANLEDGTEVTEEVELSDDIYAVQESLNNRRHIYLQWEFPEIPNDASTTGAELLLEHHENYVSVIVQWKMPDNNWTNVCNPPKSIYDINSVCDLSPYLNTASTTQNVNLRLEMICLNDCEEYLDLARLKIRYREQYQCPVCGNGQAEDGEECDDGNTANLDGCGAACKLETGGCMKINEVYAYPGTRVTPNGKAEKDPRDEWLELYNACPFQVNLKNWYLRDDHETELLNHNYQIAAHQFVIIAANASTWKYWPNIPDNAYKIALGGTKLFNGLNEKGGHIFMYDNYNYAVDGVGWGFDNSAFDPAVLKVSQGHSISRKPAGFDTDKAGDWIDTYNGSTPPGPNPGTNPHDEFGNLLTPSANGDEIIEDNNSDIETEAMAVDSSGDLNENKAEENSDSDNGSTSPESSAAVLEENNAEATPENTGQAENNLKTPDEPQNNEADERTEPENTSGTSEEPIDAPINEDTSGVIPQEPGLPVDNSTNNLPPNDSDNDNPPADLPQSPVDTTAVVVVTVGGN